MAAPGSIPANLFDQIPDIYRRITEIERKFAGRRRIGVVDQVDHAAGLYRVKLREQGDGGGPVLTPWIPLREIAMGSIKVHVPVSIGEQVVIESETGELADAEIAASLTSNAEPRPHDQGDELVITIGTTRLHLTGEEATITTGGSFIHMTPSKITLRADDIDGTVSGEVNFNQE